jgi:DNA-binding transcriptional LysR family regulator
MRFDWTGLQVFLQVCEAGSMTAAAQRCHLTLAAVSARVRQLEEANGLVLLQRLPRGVAPTAAGEVLAAHARLVLEQVRRMEHELAHAQGGASRPFVLLANSSSLARPFALAVARALVDRTLIVRESASEASVQALRRGAADVAIVSDAVDTRGLRTTDLGADPLVAVAARGHAFASCAALSFADTLQQPWIRWSESGALATHLQLRALAGGASIDARVTFPTLDGVLQLVAAGVGITVLPRALVRAHAAVGTVACVPLQEDWARRRLVACRAEGGAHEEQRERLVQALLLSSDR